MGRLRSSASREDKYGWYEVEKRVCLRCYCGSVVRVFSSVYDVVLKISFLSCDCVCNYYHTTQICSCKRLSSTLLKRYLCCCARMCVCESASHSTRHTSGLRATPASNRPGSLLLRWLLLAAARAPLCALLLHCCVFFLLPLPVWPAAAAAAAVAAVLLLLCCCPALQPAAVAAAALHEPSACCCCYSAADILCLPACVTAHPPERSPALARASPL